MNELVHLCHILLTNNPTLGYNTGTVERQTHNITRNGEIEMTKQEFWKAQRELSEAKSAAYDVADYAKVDEIQAQLDNLVDPEPDELLTGDEGLLIFPEDVGTYEDVERKHSWMRKTY